MTVARTLTAVRRTLMGLVGLQLTVAVALSLVDSYRRRGKRPKPFPVTGPGTVPVGDGEITTYTFGRDLYAERIVGDSKCRQRAAQIVVCRIVDQLDALDRSRSGRKKPDTSLTECTMQCEDTTC